MTFRQAANDLAKALDRERKNGVGPSSSVPGPLSAGNGAEAEASAPAGVPEETTAAEAGPEGEGAGPAGAEQGLPAADRGEAGIFSAETRGTAQPANSKPI